MKKTLINKWKGFTLSEVLITLGIIGVIAVLTLPTLIENYRARVWDTSEKMFITRLSDAINTMGQTGKLEGYDTTEDFVNALSNYININKDMICKPENLKICFTETIKTESDEYKVEDLKTSTDIGQNEYNSEVIGFRTNFGVDALLSYDTKCKTHSVKKNFEIMCVAVIYDVNGSKKPNRFLKDDPDKSDIRGINVTLEQIVP